MRRSSLESHFRTRASPRGRWEACESECLSLAAAVREWVRARNLSTASSFWARRSLRHGGGERGAPRGAARRRGRCAGHEGERRRRTTRGAGDIAHTVPSHAQRASSLL
eukprot:scaffold284270_cov39-Tisochrysis_lutea.AAC.3